MKHSDVWFYFSSENLMKAVFFWGRLALQMTQLICDHGSIWTQVSILLEFDQYIASWKNFGFVWPIDIFIYICNGVICYLGLLLEPHLLILQVDGNWELEISFQDGDIYVDTVQFSIDHRWGHRWAYAPSMVGTKAGLYKQTCGCCYIGALSITRCLGCKIRHDLDSE